MVCVSSRQSSRITDSCTLSPIPACPISPTNTNTNWSQALDPSNPDPTTQLIGVVICKLEAHQVHSPRTLRGYIAMLAVSSSHRGHGIATTLVKKAIDAMVERGADEVVLETEESNGTAMRLYERLGFLRSKKLWRYYLNGSSAYRLVLQLKRVADMGAEERGDDKI